MRAIEFRNNKRNGAVKAFLTVLLGVAGLMLWLTACAPNEPFDPLSVANSRPVVKMSIAAVNPEQELRPTSYYERRFSWYGSDQDGWVEEYFVSIRTEADVPAPWIATTNTDTVMSFVTDDEGNAEATFFLVCRDDRGALSDTLEQHIPLRNFQPALRFQSDFEPLRNMQREITNPGTVDADTTYWNWGAGFFRCFALDLDGAATMDAFYRYTFAEDDPAEVYDEGDLLADPEINWVRVPFSLAGEIKEFELFVKDIRPGQVTLTIAVADEAGAEDRLQFSWEVRAPKSNILYVATAPSSISRAFYEELMDERFGEGNWDTYDFWFGFPEHAFILLESIRQFEAVIWTDGGVTGNTLTRAASAGGVLESYLLPQGGEQAGKLVMISKGLIGASLPSSFLQNIMGLNPSGNNAPELSLLSGKQALGTPLGDPLALPDLTSAASAARGIGLKLLDEDTTAGTAWGAAEVIYRMEECSTLRGSCYNGRPPNDPIVGVRRPTRAHTTEAKVVGLSMQLEYFERTEAIAALMAVLDTEMGVSRP